jgi:hypothetical protein
VVIVNTFWLKVAVITVVILGSIILVVSFSPSKPKPPAGPSSVYEVWENDEERLRADPGPVEEKTEAMEEKTGPETVNVTEPRQAVGATETQPKPQFTELSIEDEIQAQKLYEMAMFHRKSGRLPVMNYKKMVDYCREIIKRWPDSEYAFKAKRMLGDIPERYRKMYDITEEETDLDNLK